MLGKQTKPKGGSAYRIKRARGKKPLRFLEIGIMCLFLVVIVFAASFTIQISKGYSKENEPTEYYINLQVLNGQGEWGLANRLANAIETAVSDPLAVRVIDTDNFENYGVEKTFVISRDADLRAARILADQLGVTEEVVFRKIDDNYLNIGATLVLGADYRERLGLPKATGADEP